MAITYDKLFDLLSELHMKRGELQKEANITASIMARLAKNETVKTETINKICNALHCQPGDIMEYLEVEEILTPDGTQGDDVLISHPSLDRPEEEWRRELMTVERARRLGLL